MIPYLGWIIVRAFTYKKIKCNKNKSLAWFVDWLEKETVHDITERSKDLTILLTFRILSLYSRSTMNRPYIILLNRPIKW